MFKTTRIKRGEEKRKEKKKRRKVKKKIPRHHARKESVHCSGRDFHSVSREARATADRQHPGQTSKQTRVQMKKSQRDQAKAQRTWSPAMSRREQLGHATVPMVVETWGRGRERNSDTMLASPPAGLLW